MVIPVSLDTIVSVGRLSSGRRLQAYDRMYPVAERLGHKSLLTKLDQGMAHERHTRAR